MAALGKALRSLKATFRALDVRWYLFGAQAAIHYGSGRSTNDADVTVDPGRHPSAAIARALVTHGFALRFADPAFIKRTRVIPVTHSGGMPVDVVLGGGGLDTIILSRTLKRRIDGILVPVASSSDIVTLKLLAGRDKDLSDVRAMLRSERTRVNTSRVRRTLADLEEALGQSDLVPLFEEILRRARRA